MTTLAELTAVFDWRSRAVLARNASVYLANWKTGFLPPAMEPVVMFLAFGLGLEGYVGTLDYHGRAIGYAAYVAPGLVAYAAFTTPFYESLYSAYVRMFYQKTWDGILATQVEVPHLVWGEILWAAARGFMNTAVVCAVVAAFGLGGAFNLRLEWLVVMPPLAFLVGMTFAAFGLIFTASVPAIDHMNYPVFLIGLPLSLTSNTYFPVSSTHPVLGLLVELNPIAHLAETARGLLVHGDPGAHPWKLALTTSALLVVCAVAALTLTKRRILK